MQNKSSGVELLVVGALALIAIVSLTFVGLTVMWNRTGDITPLVSITGVAVGALASLLVRLQGSADLPIESIQLTSAPAVSAPVAAPIPMPAPAVPTGTGG